MPGRAFAIVNGSVVELVPRFDDGCIFRTLKMWSISLIMKAGFQFSSLMPLVSSALSALVLSRSSAALWHISLVGCFAAIFALGWVGVCS